MHSLQIFHFDEVYYIFFTEDLQIVEIYLKPPGISSFPSLTTIYEVSSTVRQRIEEAVANATNNE